MSTTDAPPNIDRLRRNAAEMLAAHAGQETGEHGTAPSLRSLVALAIELAQSEADRTGRAVPTLVAETADDLQLTLPNTRRLLRDLLPGLERHASRADLFGDLLQFFGDRGRFYEVLTSPSLQDVMITLGFAGKGPDRGAFTILDLAAGAGGSLAAAAARATELGYQPLPHGVEIQGEVGILAAINLFLAGQDPTVVIADSLRTDPLGHHAVDLAITQPPFGLRWEPDDGIRALEEEGGYPFGLSPRGDATWMFVSRMISKLRAQEDGGGRAVVVVVVAASALRSELASQVRQGVLDDDLIETIVALPAGLAETTSIPLFAVSFNNHKPTRRAGHVQVVDLRAWSQASRLTLARRRLRPEATAALEQALRTVKDGPVSRTLPNGYFVKVRHKARVLTRTVNRDDARVAWRIEVPSTQPAAAEISRRYGPVAVDIDPASDQICDLDVDGLFDATLTEAAKWLTKTGWPATRLSALLTALPAVSETDHDSSPGSVLLPLTIAQIVADTSEAEPRRRRRTVQVSLDQTLVSERFVASWLQSPVGRKVVARALAAANGGRNVPALHPNGRALSLYTDEIVVPLPDLTTQERFSNSFDRLVAARSLADSAQRDVWLEPAHAPAIAGAFDALFDQSLTRWTQDLPYPVGSALWTLESFGGNPERTYTQVFHVWEAYTTFWAAVLASALSADPVLREQELPTLNTTIAEGKLSFARATFGTWTAVVQRLNSVFRDRMAAGPDELAATLELFGGISGSGLAALLSPRVATLISEANARRNKWSGHSGTVTASEFDGRTDQLLEGLKELRAITGSAWRELDCVRAGHASKRAGQIHQKVELVSGSSVPFKQAEVIVGEMMSEGELYLCTPGALRPLQIQHFVVLRPSPSRAQYTCYFYSSRVGDFVRLVTYHLAEQSETTESYEGFAAAFAGLGG